MPARLAIMPRPRGGEWLDDEIAGLRSQGIHIVASLLTDEEMVELELQQEEALCIAQGIRFIRLPIPDRGTPESIRAVSAVAGEVATLLVRGGAAVIHCRAGIGRSGLLAACIMIELGTPATTAIQSITQARGCPIPDTDEQRAWIVRYETARHLH